MVTGKQYNMSEKLFWWIRFWSAVLVVAGFAIAVGKWAFSRASVEYVDRSISTRETIENVQKVDRKIEAQQKVLGNVRDNIIILMDRQQVKPKPLPVEIGTVDACGDISN